MRSKIDISFRSYAAPSQVHAHPFCQIVLPSRGVLDLEIAGRSGCVNRDCAVVIGAGERHAFCARAEINRFLVVDILVPEWTQADSETQLERLSERQYAPLSQAAHCLIGYAEQMSDGSRLTSLWLELLLEELAQTPRQAPDPSAKALLRAKAFVDRSFDQPIEIKDIARVAGLGASRLHELFQQRLGTTPRGYLTEVRLRKALSLLANTSLSIAEIAARTGHADQSTLTRHLRRAAGTTPAAYRRQCKS